MNEIFPQEPDKQQNTQRNYTKKYVIKTIIIVSITLIALFLLIILFTRNYYQEQNNAYMSNLTNTSIVQGYMVGYQMCNEGMMNMINQSMHTCQLIRANISGIQVELVPITCLNETKK